MSQAESRNTTNPSRRGVLAGISIAVAPAMAAVDKSLGAVALPDDPIFTAIDLHRKAWSERERTYKIFRHSDEEPLKLTGIVVGEYPATDWKIVKVDGLRQMHEFRTGEMTPIIAHTEQIAANAPTDLTGAEQTAWIRSKTTEMRRRHAVERARYNNTPRSLAYDAWNAACIAAEAVTEQLANTRPTTIGRVAAVLAYWSEIASEDHFETDLGSTVTFMEALAEAVREIA
jgi:hypothetical protein